MPAAINIAAEIAIGAPNPASDSSSAPKQNAMRINWMRWSSDRGTESIPPAWRPDPGWR
jgi:hypothetical protein